MSGLGALTKESSLVSLHYPMLTRSNYATWAIKMNVFIRAQGIWDAVEHDDPKEKVDMKKDQIALAAIYQGIPEETLQAVSEKETSNEAWECIKVMYLGAKCVEDARVQTLREELDGLRMKSTESVDDFVMKIVTSIEQFDDLETMTVEEVFDRLQAYEERLRGNVNDIHINAEHFLLTREQWRVKVKKNGGEGSSNSGGQGNKNWKFDKAKVRCYKCKDYGHYQWECEESKKQEKALFMAAEKDDHPALL
ncbi:uncharacterized protein LOC133896949 [Phragmites australis]|uniref:uncharacterized protein LOC133896949 n=1 Tax=Phragmites australis TaxID=29695 RepID=UPI002D79E164|nr:uncharacterized protein LOC133896949 [Phragmites australis]